MYATSLAALLFRPQKAHHERPPTHNARLALHKAAQHNITPVHARLSNALGTSFPHRGAPGRGSLPARAPATCAPHGGPGAGANSPGAQLSRLVASADSERPVAGPASATTPVATMRRQGTNNDLSLTTTRHIRDPGPCPPVSPHEPRRHRCPTSRLPADRITRRMTRSEPGLVSDRGASAWPPPRRCRTESGMAASCAVARGGTPAAREACSRLSDRHDRSRSSKDRGL